MLPLSTGMSLILKTYSPMTSNLLTIMQNDSVAARLFSGYPYRRSLMGEKEEEAYDSAVDGMEDGLIINLYDFFYSIPIWFYVSLLVLLLLFILFRLYQSGFFDRQWQIKSQEVMDDDIYQVDYDGEQRRAMAAGDYSALVRLAYLRTLRALDESGRIHWRIYKTPMQFASEARHPAFDEMTRLFTRIRYGQFSADESQYRKMCDWQEAVTKGGEA